MSNNRIQTQSIDDILDNIRSAINKPVSKQLVSDNYGGYDLLELTDVVQDDGTILQVKKIIIFLIIKKLSCLTKYYLILLQVRSCSLMR